MLLKGASHVIDENGQVQEHCFQIGDEPRAAKLTTAFERARQETFGAAKLAAESQDAQTTYPTGPATSTKATKPSAKLNTRQLLAQLRSRLRDVEHEIGLRKELETERDQIKRLIGAAKAEQNNVRRIRAAG